MDPAVEILLDRIQRARGEATGPSGCLVRETPQRLAESVVCEIAALQARLAAAEAAVAVRDALLAECRRAVQYAKHDSAMLEDQVAWDAWNAVLARIDATAKED